jgi:hypothetical protein
MNLSGGLPSEMLLALCRQRQHEIQTSVTRMTVRSSTAKSSHKVHVGHRWLLSIVIALSTVLAIPGTPAMGASCVSASAPQSSPTGALTAGQALARAVLNCGRLRRDNR